MEICSSDWRMPYRQLGNFQRWRRISVALVWTPPSWNGTAILSK
jgi:hypothetical protein